MRRRFAMFTICGSKSATSDDENNKITDSLEQCLSLDKGVKDFQSFLKRGKFEEDEAALEFYLKCKNILTEASRYSPNSRTGVFSSKLNEDVLSLLVIANNVNFDQHQMEDLENTLDSGTDEEKFAKIAEAQRWSLDILQDIYGTFRRDALNNKR